jgi:hypothetical protein
VKRIDAASSQLFFQWKQSRSWCGWGSVRGLFVGCQQSLWLHLVNDKEPFYP